MTISPRATPPHARNPAAAVRLIESFIRRFELVGTQPRSRIPTDQILPGLRHLVIGQYVAFYRVEAERVVIVRVLHGKRDVTAEDLG